MTLQTYERAQELRSKINHYEDIKDTLANSVGNYLRASTTDYTMNKVIISEEDKNLMDRLIAVVNEDIRTLQEEFEGL